MAASPDLHFRDAVFTHRRHGPLVRGELDPARHVLRVAIGEVRADDQRLLVPGLQPRRGRKDLEPGHGRIPVGRRRGAGGDPLRDHAIFRRAGRETLTAAVRDGEGRLQKHEASGRLDLVDAARRGLARQGQVVEIRIVSAQRQLESVLARQRAMARARVAPGARENGHDVVTECQRIGRGCPLDLDDRRRRHLPGARGDDGAAVADRRDDAGGVYSGDVRIGGRERRRGGAVTGVGGAGARLHDELLPAALPAQDNGVRKDGKVAGPVARVRLGRAERAGQHDDGGRSQQRAR